MKGFRVEGFDGVLGFRVLGLLHRVQGFREFSIILLFGRLRADRFNGIYGSSRLLQGWFSSLGCCSFF